MFSPDEVIVVGHLNRTFGIEGGIRVAVDETFENLFEGAYAFLFVDMDGEYVPFRILKWDRKGEKVVFLKDINSIDQAKQITGKPIVVPIKDLPANYMEDHFNWSDFEVLSTYSITIEHQNEYPIIEIQEFPQQLTAIIIINDEEVMLPLVEAFIQNIDHANKSIFMTGLPDGLLPD